uniref:Uncharacterized protein n=1 Tax=Oryza sativa subsp. japonica TaxID=39947 RepID=Q6YV07_ORYSJ|nr:hypothetical protein [Oryza sativa Japonica Group]BAD08122.1 hypothetical protein [Oryza sativa Japonica Group]
MDGRRIVRSNSTLQSSFGGGGSRSIAELASIAADSAEVQGDQKAADDGLSKDSEPRQATRFARNCHEKMAAINQCYGPAHASRAFFFLLGYLPRYQEFRENLSDELV